jgi:hypothetical protein
MRHFDRLFMLLMGVLFSTLAVWLGALGFVGVAWLIAP